MAWISYSCLLLFCVFSNQINACFEYIKECGGTMNSKIGQKTKGRIINANPIKTRTQHEWLVFVQKRGLISNSKKFEIGIGRTFHLTKN